MKRASITRSAFDPDIQNEDAEYRIVAALEKISEAFRVLLWDESKKTGLSPIQIQLLIFILFQPARRSTITNLAREFHITKPTVSDSVKVLEQKKLIKRNHTGSDNRSFTLSLTARGRKIATSGSIFANAIHRHIQSLGRGNQAALLGSLLEIIRQLGNAGVITPQRMCRTCRYFTPGKTQHYCTLIKQPLRSSDLRLDCPEHQPAIPG